MVDPGNAVRPAVLLVLALLALPTLAPAASACNVPCGRIYPSITMALPDGSPAIYPSRVGETIEVPILVKFRFDALNEGYTVALPNEQVKVSFEFPRKPAWVDMAVEPADFVVPVNNPLYLVVTPDTASPQVWYEYSQEVTARFTVTGQAVLKDGYDFQKLLIFAKSSESGLFQAGYGIKEIKTAPEGALHESDLAGSRDVFVATALPPLVVPDVETSFGGVTARLSGVQGKFWSPTTLQVALDPAPAGRAMLALHDEKGDLVAMNGPIDAARQMTLNATLVAPGHHTLSVTLLPTPGTTGLPIALALPFVAGDVGAEGHVFPKSYAVETGALVPAPQGNADPLVQWERDVPFFAFDRAQSVSALVTLATPGVDAGRGLANLQLSLIDPDGKTLQTTSVDAYTAQKVLRMGSLPVDGWYALRLSGTGAPVAAEWRARIEVAYALAPEARNRADGVPDLTGPLTRRVGANATLPLEDVQLWAASPITPTIERAGVAYALTLFAPDGTLAYASGLRHGAASWTPHVAGDWRAFAYFEPAADPFPPETRAFSFRVGEAGSVTATTFAIEDAPEAPTSATDSVLAIHAFPWHEGADIETRVPDGRADVVDADGRPVERPSEQGTYYVRVLASNPGPAKTVPVSSSVGYPEPVIVDGAPPAPAGAPPVTVPGVAVGGALAALGLVAVGIALMRRP